MRTARAKGLSRRAALWRHALPNAAPPILTIAGLQFSSLIAGAVVVENVFVLPGLGRLIAQSIANRDVLVVEDCVMGLAGLVILVNAGVDLAAAAIDPRLRAGARDILRLGVLCVGLLIFAALPVARLDALSARRDRRAAQARASLGGALARRGRARARRRLGNSRRRARVAAGRRHRRRHRPALGVALGLVAASAKGVLEDAIMKASDFAFAFPALLLAILLTSTYGPGVVNAIVAIGVANAPVFAKLTRDGRERACWRANMCSPRGRPGADRSPSPSSTCCPTSPPRSSCRRRSSSPSRSSPRRRCPIWASARSRRSSPGADARRRAGMAVRRAAARGVSGPGGRLFGAGPQPARRRPARRARPETAGARDARPRSPCCSTSKTSPSICRRPAA